MGGNFLQSFAPHVLRIGFIMELESVDGNPSSPNMALNNFVIDLLRNNAASFTADG